MEGVEALQRVVDRLEEWFGDLPRATILEVLREETADYQQRLRRGETPGPSAEHAAFARLAAMRPDALSA